MNRWVWILALGCIYTEMSLASEQGLQAYRDGRFEAAEEDFRQMLQEKPSSHLNAFNLGTALYRQKKFADAEQFFDQAAQSDDLQQRSEALFNRGLSEIMQGKLQEAKSSFQDALSYNLEDQRIRDNLQWVEQQLQNKQEQKENQQQGDSQDTADQKQDSEPSNDSSQNQQQQGNKPNDDSSQNQGQDEQQQDSSGQQDLSNEERSEQGQGNDSQQQESGGPDDGDQKMSGQDQSKNADEDLGNKQADNSAEQDPKAGDNQQADSETSQAAAEGENLQNEQDLQPNESGASGGAVDRQGGKHQEVMTAEEMKRQDAEKLIRSIEDQVGKYYLPVPPEDLQRSKNEKSW